MERSRCAVCGGNILEGKTIKQEYKGEEYYFCSEQCRIEFLKEPNKYKLIWPSFRKEEIDTATLLKCAVCGGNVSEEKAHKQEYQEETSYEKYYFCSGEHRMEFLKDPDKYAGQSGKHVT